MMRILSHGISDIGKKRTNNEDVFAILDGSGFYALADGMGGHQAGEVAARLTIDILCRRIVDDVELRLPLSSDLLSSRLLSAIQETNEQVYKHACLREDWSGMGTTLSCLLLREGLFCFGHVGDSRIYQLRDRLKQISCDHIANNEKNKRKITKAVGTSWSLEPEVGVIAPLPGDLFLICSDGLTDHLSDAEIEQILMESSGDLQLICSRLVHCANHRGGHDNITILALKIEESSCNGFI